MRYSEGGHCPHPSSDRAPCSGQRGKGEKTPSSNFLEAAMAPTSSNQQGCPCSSLSPQQHPKADRARRCGEPGTDRDRAAHRPWPVAPSLLSWIKRPFSFFPNRRPMEDLIPFLLEPLCKESWLLLGLLAWSSSELGMEEGEEEQSL